MTASCTAFIHSPALHAEQEAVPEEWYFEEQSVLLAQYSETIEQIQNTNSTS